MTISVANRLYQPGSLPDLERLVLSIIDGGAAWLDWAARDPGHQYHFRDAREMVGAVQSAIHGTPILLFSQAGLWVGPAKLMTMSLEDVRILVNAERFRAPAEKVLRKYDLVDEAGFKTIPDFLEKLGVGGALLFQTRGLLELLDLVKLQRSLDPADPLAADAAAFAVGIANNTAEFVDYLRIYLDLTRALSLASQASDKRGRIIEGLIDALRADVFGLLEGPVVEGVASAREVEAAVRQWLHMGRSVGFARASLALQQIVKDRRYTGQTGRDLSALRQSIVSTAQHMISVSRFGEGRLAQDGATCVYRLEASGNAVDIEVTASGQISLVGLTGQEDRGS